MSGDTARSMSVRARINNLAKELGIAPQHALQRYFTERFLARVAASPYANNLVIKGGTLMSAILGVAHRTTMDIDATIIGMKADESTIEGVVAEIAAIEVGDGIEFKVGFAQLPHVLQRQLDGPFVGHPRRGGRSLVA